MIPKDWPESLAAAWWRKFWLGFTAGLFVLFLGILIIFLAV